MRSSYYQDASLAPSTRINWGVLISITWFFILQPYVSPLPMSTDLQPVALIIAGLILLFNIIFKKSLSTRFSFLLLLSLFIELIHLVLFNKVAAIYIATYIFLAFVWQYSSQLSVSLIRGVMGWHLFGIVWQVLDPASFEMIFEYFLREIKYTSGFGRGATGFTPEPTFAGALSTVYALVYFRFLCYGDKTNSKLLFFFMYLLSIILTSSALGYIFLPIVLLTAFLQQSSAKFKIFKVSIVTLIILCITVTFFNLTSTNQRGLVFAKKLLTAPELIVHDSSLQERFRSLYIGFSVMIEKPMGMGHGNFPSATEWAHENLNLDTLFSKSRDIKGSASGAGNVMAGAGMLGAGFYLFVFFSLIGRSSIVDFGVWVVSLGMFTVSFSPAFPLIYTLLVLRKKYGHSYLR